ncbi:hypothetical protein PoB_001828400 [Plakobranchus ocellatus]|uniref:Uncharacterized protein n=1 Tax=Plakobranchus ocellatus TaxID=259542 RepID=A0AAV3ZD15_9GAST|nr:hypothetical protein PoB_001828400 [Plakobranchus ocellatus]
MPPRKSVASSAGSEISKKAKRPSEAKGGGKPAAEKDKKGEKTVNKSAEKKEGPKGKKTPEQSEGPKAKDSKVARESSKGHSGPGAKKDEKGAQGAKKRSSIKDDTTDGRRKSVKDANLTQGVKARKSNVEKLTSATEQRKPTATTSVSGEKGDEKGAHGARKKSTIKKDLGTKDDTADGSRKSEKDANLTWEDEARESKMDKQEKSNAETSETEQQKSTAITLVAEEKALAGSKSRSLRVGNSPVPMTTDSGEQRPGSAVSSTGTASDKKVSNKSTKSGELSHTLPPDASTENSATYPSNQANAIDDQSDSMATNLGPEGSAQSLDKHTKSELRETWDADFDSKKREASLLSEEKAYRPKPYLKRTYTNEFTDNVSYYNGLDAKGISQTKDANRESYCSSGCNVCPMYSMRKYLDDFTENKFNRTSEDLHSITMRNCDCQGGAQRLSNSFRPWEQQQTERSSGRSTKIHRVKCARVSRQWIKEILQQEEASEPDQQNQCGCAPEKNMPVKNLQFAQDPRAGSGVDHTRPSMLLPDKHILIQRSERSDIASSDPFASTIRVSASNALPSAFTGSRASTDSSSRVPRRVL